VYDRLCTAIYPELSTRMAMKIGGKKKFENLYVRHWVRFASGCGLAPPQVLRRLKAAAKALPAAADGVAGELRTRHPATVYDTIIEEIEGRCARVLSRLADP
jgi:serine/threonine-protein kinase HipA